MTTHTQSPHEIIAAALKSLMTVEVFMLLVWAMTLLYMILQDSAQRESERTERVVSEQRHQEVMESLRATRANITQSIQFYQRQGRFEEIREKQNER